MNNNIVLKIGSVFSGEGLQNLQKGVQQANQHVHKGISVATGLASSMASVDTSASRAATAAGGLVQAFAQGGITGAAFAAVTMLINDHLKKLQEELDAIKKEAADSEARMKKTFSEDLTNRITKIAADAKSLGTEFERTAKHAEQVAAAIAGLASSKATGGIIALETEKLNATMVEMDEQLRSVIAASYDVEIASAKLAKVEEDSAAKVEAAKQAYLANQQRVQSISNQIASIDEAIAMERKKAAAIRAVDEEKAREILSKISTLEKEKANYLERQKDAIADSTALELKYQISEQDRLNAIETQTNAVRQSEAAEKKLRKAVEERALAEMEAAEEASRKEVNSWLAEDLQDQLAEALGNETAARNDAAKAEQDLVKAEAKLKAAIEAYNANLAENGMNESIADSRRRDNGKNLSSYMSDLMRQVPKIAESAKENAIKQGLANGSIKTVNEAQKIGNEAAREARIAITKQAALQVQEAQRAARLEKLSEKAISKADAEWLKRYKEIEKAKLAAQKAIADQKRAVDDAKKQKEQALASQKKSFDDIRSIRQRLETLGLK